ncbi:MAG: hypothetical protein NC039_02115 [Muribaculaceae bacterium]|nr:hypothetical protein [Muribaculaceae bacterium]
MLILTLPQMLDRWKLHHGLLPLADSSAVSLATPDAADTLLTAQIEEWYMRLLLTAPPHLIDPVDYSNRVALPEPVEGGVTVTLPPEALRLISVRLVGWWCDARIITDPDEGESILSLQHDPYTRATPFTPIAIVRPGGRIMLYPAGAGATAQSLLCAARHSDGTYHFHEAALGEIMP